MLTLLYTHTHTHTDANTQNTREKNINWNKNSEQLFIHNLPFSLHSLLKMPSASWKSCKQHSAWFCPRHHRLLRRKSYFHFISSFHRRRFLYLICVCVWVRVYRCECVCECVCVMLTTPIIISFTVNWLYYYVFSFTILFPPIYCALHWMKAIKKWKSAVWKWLHIPGTVMSGHIFASSVSPVSSASSPLSHWVRIVNIERRIHSKLHKLRCSTCTMIQ